MDEILYHLSRHCNNIQLQLDSCLQHCRQFGSSVTAGMSSAAQDIISVAWTNNLKLVFQRTLVVVQNAAKSCTSVLAQPGDIYYHLTDLGNIEMPIIYPGGVGFLVGAFIGVMIGLALRIQHLPAKRMKAVVSLTYNGLDALAFVDDAIAPILTKPQEILIQVKSASADVVDIKVSNGYGRTLRKLLNDNGRSELPVILGRDCAGIIVEIGHKVSNFDLGDEVWFVAPFWSAGTMAEYVLATEDMVSKKPSCLTFEAAASIPYSGCIAYDACLKAGIIDNREQKRVFIQGGLSPVGCIACQLAKLNNCEVTVTCPASYSDAAEFLKPDKIIVYEEMENGNILSEISKNKFDVVIITDTGEMDDKSLLKFFNRDSKVVSTVLEQFSYDDFGFPLSLFTVIYLRVKYFCKKVTKSSNQWDDVDFSAEILENLRALVDAKLLHPVVGRIYTAEDAMLALQHCKSLLAIGKTVIKFT